MAGMSDRPFFFYLIGNSLDNEEDTIATATDEAKKKNTSSTKSAKTRAITDNDVRKFKVFLVSQGESREPFQMDVALLGSYLSKYIQQMKRTDGDEYEPQTAKGTVYSIERYLKEHDYQKWTCRTRCILHGH